MPYKALFTSIALGVAVMCGPAQAGSDPQPTALGLWLNPAQGWVVETQLCASGLCGYLVSFLKGNATDPDHVARDSHNPDAAKRGTPLCGLKLLGNFTPSTQVDTKWDHGWVYDPDSGSTYTGEAVLTDANTVRLRGYVLIPLFGRTLTLVRQTGTVTRCAVPPDDALTASAVNAAAMANAPRIDVSDVRRR